MRYGTSQPEWKRKLRVRRHHNNSGIRQVQRGKTERSLKVLAEKLNIKYEVL